jgi:hypothetical protein
MELKFKQLKGDDLLFRIIPMLGKLDVVDDVANAYTQGSKSGKLTKEQINARGIKIFAGLAKKALTNLPLIRDDVNSLLADLTGKSVDDVINLSVTEYTRLIIGLFKSSEIREAFTSAVALVKETATAGTA